MEWCVGNVAAGIWIFRLDQFQHTIGLGLESITDFLKRIVAAEIPFVKKFKKVIGVTDFLRVGIAVQRDDISILVDNDTKSFAPKQVIKHQVVECGNIVRSPKKSDDGIIVQDRNSGE